MADLTAPTEPVRWVARLWGELRWRDRNVVAKTWYEAREKWAVMWGVEQQEVEVEQCKMMK